MLNIYVKTQNLLQSLKNDERGQDLIEYALLGALIAIACVATMKTLAGQINTTFGTITAAL